MQSRISETGTVKTIERTLWAKFCWRSVVSLLALALSSLLAANGQAQELKPETILKQAAARYTKYSSYQDVGVVITSRSKDRGIEEKPFKLYFSRPNRFRFEWLDYYLPNERTNVVWCDGQNTYTYFGPDRFEKKASIELGVAAATGISSGAAATIPTLLMPEIADSLLHDLTNLELLGVETFEGELCYRIKGAYSDGDTSEVWISQRDFLVRKLITYTSFDDYSTVEEEIHRDIKINQPIAKDMFDFKPPIPLGTADNPKAFSQPLATHLWFRKLSYAMRPLLVAWTGAILVGLVFLFKKLF